MFSMRSHIGGLNEAFVLFYRCRYMIFFYIYETTLSFFVPAKAAVTYTNINLALS